MEELILNSKNVNIDIKNSQCKTYQLNDKTKEHISVLMGLPFDEIINMDYEELERYIELKIGKKPEWDLKKRIDGIPLDDEHILTLEQVDKELDKITNEQRLLLKK